MDLIVTILVPTMFVVFLVLERLFPARALPPVRYWLAKGVLFFVVMGILNAVIPAIVATATADHAPVHLSALGVGPATLILFLVGDLVAYVVHRSQHVFPWMWRWMHQMHHSAERVDVAGSVYFHPFDMAVGAFFGSAVPALLGAGGEATALAGAMLAFYSFFQHLNVKTPRWLGYVIQRPEQHSVHHARGVHAYNYANIPLWDLLFGTFKNPADFVAEAGFWDGASGEVSSMLRGRDVSTPTPAREIAPLASADAQRAA
jgi:sterol desaturase/sphingolipid hydroxylase (fatty acid hydroxylase superfamily)